MNTQIQQNPQKEGWLRRTLKAVVNNWPWKLLSLFLAVCLWAGLITQDPTLTRERVFTDASVSVTGADTLRRNGMIVVSGLEDENLSARLRVDVPQREYNTVAASNYNPRVELSRITEPGEQQIKLYATSTTAYGSVQDIYPATIDIVVDEYVTNYRIPVSVNVTGEYPEGFYGGAFTRDPSLVALSGPKTLVDQVARIYVDYDASMLKGEPGEVATALPMRFVNRDGEEIVSDLLEVTSSGVVLRSIIIEQDLYPIRVLPVSQLDIISGEPAHGYQVTGTEISPTVLRAAGDETIINDITSLFVESAVDVTGATESFTATLRVKKPSELAYLNSTNVNVTVTVEPVIISSSLPSVKVRARGAASGQSVSLDTSSLSAIVTGPQLTVESLRPSDVTAYVDVSGLAAGEYTLPVQFHAEDQDVSALSFQATPSTIVVTIHEH